MYLIQQKKIARGIGRELIDSRWTRFGKELWFLMDLERNCIGLHKILWGCGEDLFDFERWFIWCGKVLMMDLNEFRNNFFKDLAKNSSDFQKISNWFGRSFRLSRSFDEEFDELFESIFWELGRNYIDSQKNFKAFGVWMVFWRMC